LEFFYDLELYCISQSVKIIEHNMTFDE